MFQINSSFDMYVVNHFVLLILLSHDLTEEFLNEEHNDDETRRMDFVDSLLNLKNSELIAPADSNQVSLHGKLEESNSLESYSPRMKVQNSLLPGQLIPTFGLKCFMLNFCCLMC